MWITHIYNSKMNLISLAWSTIFQKPKDYLLDLGVENNNRKSEFVSHAFFGTMLREQ